MLRQVYRPYFHPRLPLSNFRATLSTTPRRKMEPEYHATALPTPAVELPTSPKYPCPFITEADLERYLKPLYSTGWGISVVSAVLAPAKGKPVPAATQLSKRISFPNADIANVFIEDAKSLIVQAENHHPVWDKETAKSLNVHVHTHSAIAPENRRNVEDTMDFPRTRPGITHRDIRFALLLDSLLKDYIYHRLLQHQPGAPFLQPENFDVVHNFIPST
ncbi:hypothetical protein M422DRAFT_246762 [Sphaerobolus stellatus SS14]|nr:hypothetical protein M422DRAFT_246762 [Sphaerobolus stellatus SS14]